MVPYTQKYKLAESLELLSVPSKLATLILAADFCKYVYFETF